MPAGAKTALVLSGGGARAAYEVGVLKAVREIVGVPRANPFPIVCGVSGGALNAAFLAMWAEDPAAGIEALEAFWSRLAVGDIYRTARGGARWLGALALGRLAAAGPPALFDTGPLRQLLERELDFDRLDAAIASRALHALAIACAGYSSGQCVNFFQGRADLEPWQRSQRVGAHVKLGVEHVLASMATPFLFPPVRLHREYFGDGTMRGFAPLSPAIRLGADRILAIGGCPPADDRGRDGRPPPTLADTAGHVLAGLGEDRLATDLERMAQINRLAALVPEPVREQAGSGLRPVDLLVIRPSQRLEGLALAHAGALPSAARRLLRDGGSGDAGGGTLASYLLFEPAQVRSLIELGHRDALARRDEIAAFLELT